MKTRRSLRLPNSFSNNSMQSVLFPTKKGKNVSGIVPETPGNYYTSVKSTLASPTASVLETPDDDQIKISKYSEGNTNPRQISPISEDPTCHKRQSNNSKEVSLITDRNSDLTFNKRMGITAFLESDYSLARCDAGKKEYILPLFEEESFKPIRKGRKSLAETIFPFDLNNEKLIAKKHCNMNLRMEDKCKMGRRKSFKSPHNTPSSTNHTPSIKHHGQNNMSLDNLNGTIINSLRRKSRPSINATKLSFENSNLDLTDINKENNIVLDGQRVSSPCLRSIPRLNLSTTDDESDEVFLNNSTKKQENSDVSIENFSPSREKLLKTKRKLSLFKENSSPMTNYQRIIEEELSPLSRSVFHLQDSFTPTQPASVLILQGIVAFVDVRNETENRSSVFKDVLLELGAEIAEKFTIDVTHVIFREGSRLTYQRSIQRGVHLVSPLWVDACKVKAVRVSESLFPISADYVTKMTSGVRKVVPRKMKSMQPRNLADEVLIAELRQKRKQRLLSRVSSNLPEPQTPSIKSSACSEDVNSPLFGIAHLLTPVRERGGKSTQSESSEKSSTEKELSTPLATRMYNRFLSPISNSPQTRINLPSTSFKKSHEEDRKGQVRIPHASTPRRRSVRLHERLTLNLPVGEENDLKLKTNDSTLGRPELADERAMEDSSASRNSEKSVTANPNLINDSKNFPSETNNFESTPERSKIKSKDEDKLQKSILKKNVSPSRRGGCHSVSYKNSHVENSIRTEPTTSSPRFGTLPGNVRSSSLPSCSQELSQGARKRRLHTVEIIEPSQNLIIPLTPPISLHTPKAGPYDTLQKHFPLSQREKMRRLNKNFKEGFTIVPLPRTRNENKVGSPACDKKLASSKSPLSKQEKVLLKRTPKRRFSLVPAERKSFEEFQSPQNGRRRVANYRRTVFNGLPSICVTSVRSSNIGTLYAIIKSLGRFHITSDVDDKTTHVICGAEKRTLNLLLGISLGCWILDVSWLYESVELLKWAPEEPFELFMFCPGARISRMSTHSDSCKPNLFRNMGRIYVSHSNEPPQYIVQSLLQNCGANLCSTIRSADLIVGSEKLDASLKQVHTNWLFDSIQFWDVKKIENYLI